MKHLALDYHFVHENVQSRKLYVSYIPKTDKLAGTLTKPLPQDIFLNLIYKIGLTKF